jgi:hypothetical protein
MAVDNINTTSTTYIIRVIYVYSCLRWNLSVVVAEASKRYHGLVQFATRSVAVFV